MRDSKPVNKLEGQGDAEGTRTAERGPSPGVLGGDGWRARQELKAQGQAPR